MACCLALAALVASNAHANDYVCELGIMPPSSDLTRGNFGYIAMYTTKQPNCDGAMSMTIVCSRNATSHVCGAAAQYSEPMLISLYEMLGSAEATQHPIVATWDTCINAGGSCTGGVLLFPEF
jgi:hypothetical protein